MAIKSVVRKEEADIEREERWVIRETQFLENFKEDIQEIFELQNKVTALHKSAEKGLSRQTEKKLKAIHTLINRDKNKFKRFRRVLARSERRIIRYEKRVLGKIAIIEQGLDKPKKKELEDLISQVHVYSARVLTELSWRVGKVMKLTSQKTPNLSQIKKHLDATLEASKALIVLLERLEQFMKAVENKIHEKKLIHSLHPQLTWLNDYIKQGMIKTTHVKSIKELKELLEKKMAVCGDWRWTRTEYQEVAKVFWNKVEENKEELSKVLTEQDIEQLKKVEYGLPKRGVFLFLPGFGKPIIAFNIENLPHFEKPGWLFHALFGEHLNKISRRGLLSSPLETIFRHKHYFSHKFWENEHDTKRIIDGISFAFQNHERYLGYALPYSSFKGAIGKGIAGGFFIFPIRNTIKKGLILDFRGTIDQYPEICLRDPSYAKHDRYSINIVQKLLIILRKEFPIAFRNLKLGEELFKAIKKDPSFIEKILESSVKANRGYLYFSRDIDFNPYYGSCYYSKNQEEVIIIPEKNYVCDLLARFRGSIKRDKLMSLLQYCKEDNFLFFYLLLSSGWLISEKDYSFTLARYASGEAPTFLNDTIFQSGFDYLPKDEKITLPKLLTLTLMKSKPPRLWQKGFSVAQYVEELKRMSPKQVKKLMQRMAREIAIALERIIKKKYRTQEPCTVDVKSGLLILMPGFYGKRTLHNLINLGIPVFMNFGGEWNRSSIIPKKELDFFFSKVVPLKNIPYGQPLWNKNSYFYLKNGKLIVHTRINGKEKNLG